jgi:hypothetical protein
MRNLVAVKLNVAALASLLAAKLRLKTMPTEAAAIL